MARDVFVTSPDGLRLHVREYGLRSEAALPVICLAGLTRTAADFDVLAPALVHPKPDRQAIRLVIAVDSRGRGDSDYDPNPANYNLAVELADLVAVLTALDVGRAVFVGSSRGGMLTMLLAAARPSAVAGAVLHDIGPVIEPKGVARIRSYVGKMPPPRNYAEGAEILRQMFDAQFPTLTAEQWLGFAQRTWKKQDGGLVPTYDVRLASTLAEVDSEHPLPSMWKEFDALAHVPILVIRGANSDILSAETVSAMSARHPGLQSIEVADQGHVPLLDNADLLRRIVDFVELCDAKARLAAP